MLHALSFVSDTFLMVSPLCAFFWLWACVLGSHPGGLSELPLALGLMAQSLGFSKS